MPKCTRQACQTEIKEDEVCIGTENNKPYCCRCARRINDAAGFEIIKFPKSNERSKTPITTFRLTPSDLETIEKLRKQWANLFADNKLTKTDIVRIAIRLAVFIPDDQINHIPRKEYEGKLFIPDDQINHIPCKEYEGKLLTTEQTRKLYQKVMQRSKKIKELSNESNQ